MRAHQLDANTAAELRHSGFRDSGSVRLDGEGGETFAVLLSPDEYLLLSAAADLACDPERLVELLEENRLFQEGHPRNAMTPQEFAAALRG